MESELQEHINKEVRGDIGRLYEHAKIANEEMGKVNQALGIVQTDLAWLTRFFWLVAGSSVGGLVTGILNLLIK